MAEVPPGTERPRVNERFPWEWGAAIPLCVLEVLPELPEDLETDLPVSNNILALTSTQNWWSTSCSALCRHPRRAC